MNALRALRHSLSRSHYRIDQFNVTPHLYFVGAAENGFDRSDGTAPEISIDIAANVCYLCNMALLNAKFSKMLRKCGDLCEK